MAKLYQGDYRITSWFGPRTLDNGDGRIHKGIDCVGLNSKRIIAPTNGRIVSSQIIIDKSNPTWEWGNYVKLDDLNGYYLFFCHLASRAVVAGQSVTKGQFIGLEGQTGYSFGSHLHFEVRRKSDNVSINPLDYFEILEGRKEKVLEVKTVDEALKILKEKGVMNTTEYWKNAAGVVKYLDSLLINMANKIK